MPLLSDPPIAKRARRQHLLTRTQLLGLVAFVVALIVGTGLIFAEKVLTSHGTPPRANLGVLGVCLIIFASFCLFGGRTKQSSQ